MPTLSAIRGHSHQINGDYLTGNNLGQGFFVNVAGGTQPIYLGANTGATTSGISYANVTTFSGASGNVPPGIVNALPLIKT